MNESITECFYPRPYISSMTIANRLDEAMRTAEIESQSALSRLSGVPQPTINRILKGGGKKGPETETLRKLAIACNVSFDWLNEGIEPKVRKSPHSINSARAIVALHDDEEAAGIIRIKKVLLRLSAGIAGFSTDPIEEDENPISFRSAWLDKRGYIADKLVAIEIRGQSMESGLYEGDTVVVNTADILPKDGEVYAVNYEGEAVVKRLVREMGSWWLVSDNPDQRRFPRKQCSGDMCIIIGRVIHKQSERI